MGASVYINFICIMLVNIASSKPIITDFDCSFNSTYPKQYIAYKLSANEQPDISDGKLTDKAWQDVPFSDLFIDIANHAIPRFNTQMKMRWDDNWLYVGAQINDPEIWANLTQDETVIFHDNDFEIFVDADATNHYYKEYEMNANNNTWNLCLNVPYSDGGYENSTRVFGKNGWTMIPPLQCGTYVNGKLNDPTSRNFYWSVEVKMPISGLLYNQTQVIPGSKNGTFWRINFSRVEWHVLINDNSTANHSINGYGYEKINGVAEDNWVWSSQAVVDMHQPDRWGILQFSVETDPLHHPTNILYYREWSIREMAMSVYYAEKAYIKANAGKTYTDNLNSIQPYTTTPLNGTCLISQPVIKLIRNTTNDVIGYVATVENNKYIATVTQNRYLQVSQSTKI
eukprot:514031_1